MSPVKEKIYGVVELMDETQAEQFWELICSHFFVTERSWANIKEEEPDEFDLQMLEEIKNNPDCNELIPSVHAYQELGLS